MTATLPGASDAVLDAIARSFASPLDREESSVDSSWYAVLARKTAIHEAGHAVAAVVLHGPEVVQLATIVGDADRELNGFVRLRLDAPFVLRWQGRRPVYLRNVWAEDYWTDRKLRNHGIQFYAGVAAQCGSPWSADLLDECERDDPFVYYYALRDSSRVDRERLADVADRLDRERDPKEWRADYWRGALRLLTPRWEAVRVVAAALLGSGTLDGEQVARLVLGAIT